MARELRRQLLQDHSHDPALTDKLMTILIELRGLAYKLDIVLARVHKEFKNLPIPASVRDIISPEGMPYAIPDIPFPGTSGSEKITPQKRSPPHDGVGSASGYYPPGQMSLSEEPPAKRINWSFVSPPPNPNSIQQTLGQTLASQVHHATGDNYGLLNGGTVNSSTPFTVQNILEKPETSSADPSTLSDTRFIYPSDYGSPFSIAHIFTQPLKFESELDSEPMVGSKMGQNVPQDQTERVITYENL